MSKIEFKGYEPDVYWIDEPAKIDRLMGGWLGALILDLYVVAITFAVFYIWWQP